MRIDSVKIRLMMAEQKTNQQDIATKCGVSRQNICITLGRGTCSAEKAAKIAKALGVSARDIIKEE